MTARDRKWVSLSALVLALVAVDLAVLAAAAPHARAWLESGRVSAVLRAGAAATRNLETVGRRTAAEAGFAVLTRFTREGHRRERTLILRRTSTVSLVGGVLEVRKSCPQGSCPAPTTATSTTTNGADCDQAVRSECPLKCRATSEPVVATGRGLPAFSATI